MKMKRIGGLGNPMDYSQDQIGSSIKKTKRKELQPRLKVPFQIKKLTTLV